MNDYSILHLIIHAKSSIKFNTVLEKSDRLLGGARGRMERWRSQIQLAVLSSPIIGDVATVSEIVILEHLIWLALLNWDAFYAARCLPKTCRH